MKIKRKGGYYSEKGLWDSIRAAAERNKRTGATPKKPTKEMLKQERKINKEYGKG